MYRILPGVWIYVFLSGGLKPLRGSHFAAMDSGLTNLGGNDYRITMVLYPDCSRIHPPATVNLPFICPENPACHFILNQVPQLADTGQEVIPPCNLLPSECAGGSLYRLREYVYQVHVRDSFGCIESDTIIIGFVPNPNIDEPENKPKLSVHPNPSDGHFDLVFHPFPLKRIHFKFSDSRGSQVLPENFTPGREAYTHSVSAGNLVHGLYLHHVKPEGLPTITQEIIIQ